MSRQGRLALALLGLILVILSLAMVAYALWPLDSVLERVPLPSEFFRPPEASLLGRGTL